MSTHYKDYYGTHMPFGQFEVRRSLERESAHDGHEHRRPLRREHHGRDWRAGRVQVESPNMPCQTCGNYGYSQDHRNIAYSITLNTRTAKGKEVLRS